MSKRIITIAYVVFLALMLALSIRGLAGNPTGTDLLTTRWREDGPFELSPERGRFALTYSIVETKSVYFPVDVARFVIPDLGYYNGHYVSLFAPALSYIVAPGYFIGKLAGQSQLGTFAVIAVLALINCLLIRALSEKLGANRIAAMVAGVLFLFATPAYAYAVNLYQHHLTTLLILLSVYLSIGEAGAWSTVGLFFLYAFGVTVDYPNMFIMAPFMIVAATRIITFFRSRTSFIMRLNIMHLVASAGVILPLIFFLGFNTISYGGPLHTLGSSFVTNVKSIGANGKPSDTTTLAPVDKLKNDSAEKNSGGLSYFKSRNLLNGLFIHFLSQDRGVLFFTPVMLLAIIGIAVAAQMQVASMGILLGVVGLNIILYSLWSDPWGGWAFGSRYLIPSYSLLAVFISLALTKYRKNLAFIGIIILLAAYSIGVNTAGALSSSANPPKVEVLSLEQLSGHEEKYTVQRNLDFLRKGDSKSYVFRTFARKYFTAQNYFLTIAGIISAVLITLVLLSYFGVSI